MSIVSIVHSIDVVNIRVRWSLGWEERYCSIPVRQP